MRSTGISISTDHCVFYLSNIVVLAGHIGCMWYMIRYESGLNWDVLIKRRDLGLITTLQWMASLFRFASHLYACILSDWHDMYNYSVQWDYYCITRWHMYASTCYTTHYITASAAWTPRLCTNHSQHPYQQRCGWIAPLQHRHALPGSVRRWLY